MAARTLGSAVGSIFAAVGSMADTTANAVIASGSAIDVFAHKARAWEHRARIDADNAIANAELESTLRADIALAELFGEIDELRQDEAFAQNLAKAAAHRQKFFEQKKAQKD